MLLSGRRGGRADQEEVVKTLSHFQLHVLSNPFTGTDREIMVVMLVVLGGFIH
jgi:hypothetical protein